MVAREATPYLAAVVLVAVVLGMAAGWAWSGIAWLVLGALLFLAREPDRMVPASPLGLISPADGTVTTVEHTFDPLLQRSAHRLEIRQSRWGAFALRNPTEGKVLLWQGRRGANGDEIGIFHVQTDEGDDVVVLARPGSRLPGLTHSRVHQGERAGQGQSFAYMMCNRGVSVYFPVTARPQVSVGDRVRAGVDIIALLDRSNGP